MFRLQRGKFIEGRLVDDHVLFDPTHLALAGFRFEKAASAFDDLQPVSIGDQGHSIRHRRHAISQVGLLGDHIDRLRLGVLAQPRAPAQRGDEGNA